MNNHREIGSRKEEEAARFLERKGYRILERNYRSRHGEIDLIALDGEVLCFIEVKYRGSHAAGSSGEGITPRKRGRIRSCAAAYLYDQRLGEDTPCRFDAVLMDGAYLRLVKDAFS